MAITVNLRYAGKNSNARKFAGEMTAGGTVAGIRAEAGNLREKHDLHMTVERYVSAETPENRFIRK